MRTICLLIASAVLASPAMAQSTQTGTPKLSSLMLLFNKDVQKELNLTDDQVKKVNEEIKFQREARKNLREANDDRERNQKVDALNQRCEQNVNSVLKNDQTRRLQQITYQVYGPNAFARTEVVEKLKLTPEQRQKIKQIQETTHKQVRGNFEPGGNREDAVKKRIDSVTRAWNQIMQVLTPDQKERWKEMTGAPFQGDFQVGSGRMSKRTL